MRQYSLPNGSRMTAHSRNGSSSGYRPGDRSTVAPMATHSSTASITLSTLKASWVPHVSERVPAPHRHVRASDSARECATAGPSESAGSRTADSAVASAITGCMDGAFVRGGDPSPAGVLGTQRRVSPIARNRDTLRREVCRLVEGAQPLRATSSE